MTDQIGADQISTAQLSGGGKAGAWLGRFVKDNGYVWLAFLASAALMFFMWFCNQMVPFGGRTILRVDLYHQYGPLFAELYERLTAGRSFLYSWNSGLGGGFLGNFFNYLSSPTGLLMLLFGHGNMPEAISTMVLLKCAFASGAFAHMLRRVHGKNDASIAAFGVLYSFCGWFIAYYWNVMWVDAMALLPLVLLGVYNIVHKRKFMMYTVTLAVTLVTSYYMGYMVCIFSVLFFLVTYFSEFDAAQGREDGGSEGLLPPPEGRTRHRLKDNRFLRTGAIFAFASVLGGALAAFSLLPVFMSLRSSSATSGSFPSGFSSNFQIFDFLVNHFADLYPDWHGSGPDKLPHVYCGVAAMLLAPLYLIAPKIKGREKVAHVVLLIFMYFSFNTNILNYVWHAMHFPNDLPYRFAYLYSFFLLWIAYKVFINLRDIPLRAIVGVGGFAALFAVVAEKLGQQNILTGTPIIPNDPNSSTGATIMITLAFIAAYTLVFAAMRRTPQAKAASLTMLMLCCVVTEVCAADVKNFEVTQVKANFTVDLKEFQQLKKELDESDKSFYRMELTDSRTLMDPCWFDYRGISTFSSMAYERTANLESRLGLHGNFINSYNYNPNTPVYNAMHGLKYLVENQNFTGGGSSYLDILSPLIYRERPEFTRERFTVFENRYTLPVAFWAGDALRGWDTVTGTDPFVKQGDFWNLAGAGEGVFNRLELRLRDDYHGENGVAASTSEQYVSYSGKPADTEVRIPFVLEVEEAQNVYIKADWNNVFGIEVTQPDGRVHKRHATQAVWDIGLATPEEPLSIDIVLNKTDAPANGGFYVYVYGLNMDVFAEGWETLSRGGLDITKYSDTALEGNILAPEDGLLYTSIPYDEGWQVSIDGKRVPVSQYVGIGSEDQYPPSKPVELLRRVREKTRDGRFGQWLDRRIATLDEKPVQPVRGGLLAVPLPAGGHKVALRYVPQGLYGGMMVSAAALILLAFAGLLGELLRRRREKQYVPAPPVPEVTQLFSTENLRPEDFSLEPWPAPAAEQEQAFEQSLPAVEEEAAFEQDLPAAEEEAAFEQSLPPAEEPAGEEETFQINLPERPEGEQADAGSASINAILQEMQARAEELRRKMQVEEPAPEEGDDGQSFKLV